MLLIKDVYNLFFPDTCALCNEQLVKNEEILCLKCRYELPLASISNMTNNQVEQVFYGRVSIQFGTALLIYKRKGIVQKLIHALKYKGHEDLGGFFGKWLGAELVELSRLPKIDYVIPVPLSKRKLRSRGYNQVTKFAEEIAKSLDADFNDVNLLAASTNKTQTHKQRTDRWKNVQEKFHVKDVAIFENKNVLLVDDVITTGATLEACIIELQRSKGITISVAALAFTS